MHSSMRYEPIVNPYEESEPPPIQILQDVFHCFIFTGLPAGAVIDMSAIRNVVITKEMDAIRLGEGVFQPLSSALGLVSTISEAIEVIANKDHLIVRDQFDKPFGRIVVVVDVP